jgi:chitodextrinase
MSTGFVRACLIAFTASVCNFGLGACHGERDRQHGQVGRTTQALEGDTYLLTGTVFGGSVPLGGALVEALVDGTTTVAAQDTTMTTTTVGRFTVSLPPGTYDLRVTPPAGSGYVAYTEQNIVVGSSDLQHDIVLVSLGGALSGVIRGYGGGVVPSASVWVGPASGPGTTQFTYADQNGNYTLSLPPNTYRVQLNREPGVAGTPSTYWYYYETVVVNGPTTRDFQLPVIKLQGQVRRADGGGVANATVGATFRQNPPVADDNGVSSAQTDATGHYELLVFGGTVRLKVTAPAPLPNVSLPDVTFDADTTFDIDVPDPVTVSGRVLGYGGVGLGGVSIEVSSTGSYLTATTTSDGAGNYSVTLGPGTYDFGLSRFAVAGGAPDRWSYTQRSLSVQAPMTLDFPLPVIRLEGQVTDANGSSVPNVQIVTDTGDSIPNVFYDSSHTTKVGDAAGHYQILLFKGAYVSMTATPPAPLPTRVFGYQSFQADAAFDIQLPVGFTVSGAITGRDGIPVNGANVYVTDPNSGVQMALVSSDSTGRYELGVPDGTYNFTVTKSGAAIGIPNGYWSLYRNGVAVHASRTLDFPLNVVAVGGHVTDSNGVAVPGVQVRSDFRPSGYDVPSGGLAYATSDTQGGYGFLVLAGVQTFTIYPPQASGFSNLTLSGTSVLTDFTQTVVLQSTDLVPPVIVSGPLVVHLSDTSVSIRWDTNEPASSLVQFGPDSLASSASDGAFMTHHALTLPNLLPSTVYTYRVGSVDANGNGPVNSHVLTFRTQDPPGDITLPVITSGPSVTNLGLDRAVVAWTTDEPATTVVRFGLTMDLGASAAAPEFVTAHAIALTGLQPNTVYSYRVESTDPDGNGPVSSTVLSFQTAAVADTTPPLILSGPTLLAATDTTLVVSWTTNEAATSGASYNDGSAFRVLSDGSLVTTHTSILAGLSPNTPYQITVSSADASGNGPTLAGPIAARTLAAADGAAPVLSHVRAVPLSGTSAQVLWTTNEPSNSEVPFGQGAGAPSATAATAALVTEHSVTLTGLQSGSRYYFTVVSTDVAGNRAQSSETSFVAGAASDPASVPLGGHWVVGLLAVGLAAAGARALRVIEREFDPPRSSSDITGGIG